MTFLYIFSSFTGRNAAEVRHTHSAVEMHTIIREELFILSPQKFIGLMMDSIAKIYAGFS